VHINTTNFEKYINMAEACHDEDPKLRPRQIYFMEQNQRNCAMEQAKTILSEMPDDALVILTDLDEIPSGKKN